tara:strand:+ start:677 stop:2353 length:1677 start_codon:yes stop_codon:yes gene_type:complete
MPYSTDIKDYWRRSWGIGDRERVGFSRGATMASNPLLRGTTGPSQILKAPRGYAGMADILKYEGAAAAALALNQLNKAKKEKSVVPDDKEPMPPKEEPPKDPNVSDLAKELVLEEVIKKFKKNNPDIDEIGGSHLAYKKDGVGYRYLKTFIDAFKTQYGRLPAMPELTKHTGKDRTTLRRVLNKVGLKYLSKEEFRKINPAYSISHKGEAYTQLKKEQAAQQAKDLNIIRFYEDEIFWPDKIEHNGIEHDAKEFFIDHFIKRANYGVNRQGAKELFLTNKQLADKYNISLGMLVKITGEIQKDPAVALQLNRPEFRPTSYSYQKVREVINDARKYLTKNELKNVKNQEVFRFNLNKLFKEDPLAVKNFPNLLEDIETIITKDGDIKRITKSDEDIINHVTAKDGLFSIQHGIGKKTAQKNIEYLANRFLTTRKTNSGLIRSFEEWMAKENTKNKIIEKDSQTLERLAKIEEHLAERGLQVKIGNQFYGAEDQKMFDSETGEHTAFERALNFYEIADFVLDAIDGPEGVPLIKMAEGGPVLFASGGLSGVDQYIINRGI